MCKHIKNVQTQILAKCCKRWFDCAECHREQSDHEIERDIELILACKKCKKVFRIDVTTFDPQSDGFCPRCDNQWYLEADTGENDRQMTVKFEMLDGTDQADAIRDERDPAKERRRQRLLEERIYRGDADLELELDDSDDDLGI
ncbi:CHY zinc finger domain-containing protein [Giardia muris]|uniref:CHY zinc finger domain-containing protein n=1 Tax=Giardia muris TaxID=5742 RepID=A0A4Z1SN21_GIAMU|nr:CHY zinc finger domain-containing protein [Giardia muris]|eukprot:TNJ27132.1 CHY zinc finger domain-containing protein [Giardia muris]